MLSHELVIVGKKKSNSDPSSAAKIPHKPVMCVKHLKEEMKLYCETCQCLVCRDCIVVDHRNHKQNYLEEVGERERVALQESLKETEDGLAKLEAVSSPLCQRRGDETACQ